jgi:hypothetical protein
LRTLCATGWSAVNDKDLIDSIALLRLLLQRIDHVLLRTPADLVAEALAVGSESPAEDSPPATLTATMKSAVDARRALVVEDDAARPWHPSPCL